MQVFARALRPRLRALVRSYAVVYVTGPRQAGKTTLARTAFPRFAYVSLEDPDEREFAVSDPRGFFRRVAEAPGVILDEVQRVPSLLSYLQRLVDEDRGRRFILTGSEQFRLSASVSQSLAGRAALLTLYPLSVSELASRRALRPERLDVVERREAPTLDRDMILFSGLYPRIHKDALDPRTWLSSYVQTYVERDVRSLLGVGDLGTFTRFLRLCAGRTAQLLNLSSLASDAGIAQPTAKRWLSVLEASGLVVLLRPHHESFTKTLVKMPKLHFLDSGLACHLLGLRRAGELAGHPLHGPIFESFVVSEIVKAFAHRGETAPVFYFRDRKGHEVDLIVDLGARLLPVEVKLGETIHADAFRGLATYAALSGVAGGALVHGGATSFERQGFAVRPWWGCS